MTDKKLDRFIIVGGGIGGLATALGLAQHGIKSIVLERSSKLLLFQLYILNNDHSGFPYLKTMYTNITRAVLKGTKHYFTRTTNSFNSK